MIPFVRYCALVLCMALVALPLVCVEGDKWIQPSFIQIEEEGITIPDSKEKEIERKKEKKREGLGVQDGIGVLVLSLV